MNVAGSENPASFHDLTSILVGRRATSTVALVVPGGTTIRPISPNYHQADASNPRSFADVLVQVTMYPLGASPTLVSIGADGGET